MSEPAFREGSLVNEVIVIEFAPLWKVKGEDGTFIVMVYPVLPATEKKAAVNDPVATGRFKLADFPCALTGVTTTCPAKIRVPLPKSVVILPGSTIVALTPAVANAIDSPCENTENDNPLNTNKIVKIFNMVFIDNGPVGIIES